MHNLTNIFFYIYVSDRKRDRNKIEKCINVNHIFGEEKKIVAMRVFIENVANKTQFHFR